jgi:nicotinamidase-related amidase
MTPYAQSLLICAWRQNSLAALYIDMQVAMRAPLQKTVFNTVAGLAPAMRLLDVPNHWAAIIDKDLDIQPAVVSVDLYQSSNYNSDYQLAPDVGAYADERVITKAGKSVFEEPHYQNHLDQRKLDTILVAGVSGPVCVEETLKDGLLRTPYNFVVINDGVSMGENEPLGQKIRRALAGNVDNIDHRLVSATSREVRQTLWGAALAL